MKALTEQRMETIRLLICDDHDLFREGLRALISTTEDFELVGEASNAREAISAAEKVQPDVVLMDINMPGSTCQAKAAFMPHDKS
jgi:YesN/AraC family two-component response regulator